MRALLGVAALLLALGSAGCCGCRHRHAEPSDEEKKDEAASLLERRSSSSASGRAPVG